MELVQIKGGTWYLDGAEHIPLVRLEGGKCILLDSGHGFEGADLAASLDRAGLRPWVFSAPTPTGTMPAITPSSGSATGRGSACPSGRRR